MSRTIGKSIVCMLIFCMAFGIMMFCSAKPAYADIEDVLISSAAFPDDVFRAYINKEYNKDGDNYLSLSERSDVKRLDFSENWARDIKSIYGVQLFPELGTVVFNRPMEDMDRLQYNTKLKRFYCTGFTDLDVSLYKSLEYLDCEVQMGSYITEHNSLQKLDVTGCTKLKEIQCYGNLLTEVKGLNTCTALEKANLQSNLLEDVDVGGLEALTFLRCDTNPIKTLNVVGCSSLETLYVAGGYSADFWNGTNYEFKEFPSTIKSIDLTGCVSLKQFFTYGNSLQKIDFSGCPEIEDITISKYDNNTIPLNGLDFRNCNKLKNVGLYYCKIPYVYLGEHPDLLRFEVPGSDIKELDLTGCPKLYYFDCHDNLINTLNISNCPYLCMVAKNGENQSDFTRMISYEFDATELCGYETYYSGMVNCDNFTTIIHDEGTLERLKAKSIKNAEISLSRTSYTYNGKAKKPSVEYVYKDGWGLREGREYTLSYSTGRVNAGTYYVTLKGINNFTGTATASFKINKAKNTMTVKPKTATVKYSKLKSSNQTITRKNVLTVNNPKGDVTYVKYSGNSKITIAKTTGKVTVKKGLKKGTYSIKVRVKAAGTKNYKALTKSVTFKVKVA